MICGKVKKPIPKGVTALVCSLPKIHEGTDRVYNILIDIIKSVEEGKSLTSDDAINCYKSDSNEFDLKCIFESWVFDQESGQESDLKSDLKSTDSHKIGKKVCSIIYEYMFDKC